MVGGDVVFLFFYFLFYMCVCVWWVVVATMVVWLWLVAKEFCDGCFYIYYFNELFILF